jgi:hypothetical protein
MQTLAHADARSCAANRDIIKLLAKTVFYGSALWFDVLALAGNGAANDGTQAV